MSESLLQNREVAEQYGDNNIGVLTSTDRYLAITCEISRDFRDFAKLSIRIFSPIWPATLHVISQSHPHHR